MKVYRIAYEEYVKQHPDDRTPYLEMYEPMNAVSIQSRVDPTLWVMRPDAEQFLEKIRKECVMEVL